MTNELQGLMYIKIKSATQTTEGACGSTVVEALRYTPEGRVFDSRWRHWIFSLT
jgi:hypothetical protein